jgi:arylsulfatase A-like enzyme
MELAGTVSRRAIYQAVPEPLEPIVGKLTGWLDGDLNPPAPNVDRLGMHTFTNLQFETFMADVDAESAPGRFHFVHLLLPHTPYVYEPGGNVTTDYEDTGFKQSGDPAAVRERYRIQTEHVDELLGRFVQTLRDEGLYEKATIVITGDHGIRQHEVTDNEDLGPEGVPVDDDVTHVPFLMKAPGLAPAVSDVDYQHVDFEATLRDLLKLPPTGSAGVSAFATDRPERQRVFYIDQENRRHWKYVRDEADGTWALDEYVEGPMPETAENFATTVD